MLLIDDHSHMQIRQRYYTRPAKLYIQFKTWWGRRTDDDEIRLVDHGIPIRTVATVSRELLLFLLVAAIERVPVVHVPELLPDTVTWPEEKKKTIHLCAIIYECINDSAINRRRLSRRILSYNDKMTFYWRETAEEAHTQLTNEMIITVTLMVDLITTSMHLDLQKISNLLFLSYRNNKLIVSTFFIDKSQKLEV